MKKLDELIAWARDNAADASPERTAIAELVDELDRRAAAIERVRALCADVEAEGVKAVTVAGVRRMLDGP